MVRVKFGNLQLLLAASLGAILAAPRIVAQDFPRTINVGATGITAMGQIRPECGFDTNQTRNIELSVRSSPTQGFSTSRMGTARVDCNIADATVTISSLVEDADNPAQIVRDRLTVTADANLSGVSTGDLTFVNQQGSTTEPSPATLGNGTTDIALGLNVVFNTPFAGPPGRGPARTVTSGDYTYTIGLTVAVS